MVQTIDVETLWIPSHCGIDGNEKGDYLSTQALTHATLVDHQALYRRPTPYNDRPYLGLR